MFCTIVASLACTLTADGSDARYSVQIAGGGTVDVVAVTDSRGSWWSPDGTGLDSVPFDVPGLPSFAESNPGPWWCFIVRKTDLNETTVVRLSPIPDTGSQSVWRSSSTSRFGSVVNYFDVVDADGLSLPGWKAHVVRFNPPPKRSRARLTVRAEIGQWRELTSVVPEVVPDLTSFARSQYRGERELVVVVVDPKSGARGRSIRYDDSDSLHAARAVLRLPDGTEALVEPKSFASYTSFRDEVTYASGDKRPATTPVRPDEIQSVALEVRAIEKLSIPDIALAPVTPLALANWSSDPRILFPLIGTAGFVFLILATVVAVRLTRARSAQ